MKVCISCNIKNFNDEVINMYMWVFNATFNNISVISWLSVLLVKETGVPRENHRPATSHRQTLSYNIIMSTPCLSEVRTPRNNHMFTIDA